MKTVLIFSGGMDSATLLYYLLEEGIEVSTITFNYGSRHNREEGVAAEKVIGRVLGRENFRDSVNFQLPDLSVVFKSALLRGGAPIPYGHYAEENMRQTVVPNRNMIMLSFAIGLAESLKYDNVAFGNHAGDYTVYPDCRSEFVAALSQAAKLGTFRGIEVISPFALISKADIVSMGSQLHVPYGLTYSCYEGEVVHCGKCGTCVERREAFYKAGVEDPTEYKVSFEESAKIGGLKL
jgi:7-cyano-7-deazaguanine synthase